MIPVRRLAGGPLDWEGRLPRDGPLLSGTGLVFTEDPMASLVVERSVDGGVHAVGTLEATYQLVCRRCLNEMTHEVRLPVDDTADYVCFLHTFRKSPTDRTEYTEAQPVGEYCLIYSDGRSRRVPVRARLDVPIPESPGPAQMAVPFTMPVAPIPEAEASHTRAVSCHSDS